MEAVELSVNVYAGDVPYLDLTYRHIVKQLLVAPISRRRIVVDRRLPVGRFSASNSLAELDHLLDRLQVDGVVDDVDDVDWTEAEVERVATKYFGHAEAQPVASGGSAIHPYLWAIDTSKSPLVLHFDSDILLHDPNCGDWVREAMAIHRENLNVAVTTPQGGPPQASSARDWLLGNPQRVIPGQWIRAESVSTRYFLVDRERLETALPLKPRIFGENLELTLTTSLHAAGLDRWNRENDDVWAVHPRRHNQNHVKNLAGLINLVEKGRYPFRRTGYRWDIRTEGRHFIPWWAMLRVEKCHGFVEMLKKHWRNRNIGE